MNHSIYNLSVMAGLNIWNVCVYCIRARKILSIYAFEIYNIFIFKKPLFLVNF